MFTKRIFSSAAFCCALLLAHSVHAAVATIETMTFGSMISTNNDAEYDVTVNTDNSYSIDASGFVLITPPQRGVYDIDGLPTNRAILSVDVTSGGNLILGGAPQVSLVDFQELHPATTDGAGVARITLGATARTPGTGFPLLDGTYNGIISIQINLAP